MASRSSWPVSAGGFIAGAGVAADADAGVDFGLEIGFGVGLGACWPRDGVTVAAPAKNSAQARRIVQCGTRLATKIFSYELTVPVIRRVFMRLFSW